MGELRGLRRLQTPEAPQTQARDAIKVEVTVPQRLGLPFPLKMEKLRI